MLPAVGCVTASANAVATAASTALPPSHIASTPTWDATKFWEATIPLRARVGTVEPVARAAAPTRTGRASARSLIWFRGYQTADAPPTRMVGLEGLLEILALLAAVTPPATIRLDYFHTGDAREERFALDAVVREGPWPGPPDGRIDDTQLGRYLVEVRDGQTDEPLFSRGFASIFGEWESTPEASALSRGFHESVRFPEPSA